MKKYIIGFVLGAVLFSGGVVFAKALVTSTWYQVDTLDILKPGTDGRHLSDHWGLLVKTFDEDTNVVCYLSRENGDISCLKTK